jgi:hypothetical protein
MNPSSAVVQLVLPGGSRNHLLAESHEAFTHAAYFVLCCADRSAEAASTHRCFFAFFFEVALGCLQLRFHLSHLPT